MGGMEDAGSVGSSMSRKDVEFSGMKGEGRRSVEEVVWCSGRWRCRMEMDVEDWRAWKVKSRCVECLVFWRDLSVLAWRHDEGRRSYLWLGGGCVVGRA